MMQLIKPAIAANHLGMSQSQLRAITKSGLIPAVNIGLGRQRPRLVYDLADLEARAAARELPPAYTVPGEMVSIRQRVKNLATGLPELWRPVAAGDLQ